MTQPFSQAQPLSQAAIPAQPNIEFYSIQELALFKTYSRDTYRAAFGVEAPPYDPSRRPKSWFDSTVDVSDPVNVALYKIAAPDAGNTWGIRQMVIPAQDAATVNLPGLVRYPDYVIPPTSAARGGSALNPVYLSLESEARAFMAQLGGNGLAQEEAPPFQTVYPPDEPRRLWFFLLNGQSINVGGLLFSRNANGVGAPGHWDLSAGAIWVADPAPTGLNDSRTPREVPVRNLLANEKFQAGLMGVGIVRTDLQKAVDEASGQFTSDDRVTLRLIYQMLSKLAGL